MRRRNRTAWAGGAALLTAVAVGGIFAMAMTIATSQAESDGTGDMTTRTVVVRIEADSANHGYEAWRAMDGDLETMWHTQFNAPPSGTPTSAIPISCGYGYGCNREHPKPAPGESTGNNIPPPHSLTIDLTEPFTLTGFVYTPRKGGENGTIGRYEVYISDCAQEWGEPAATGEFTRRGALNSVEFAAPKTGRYVKFTGLTEVSGQPFTSVAELELRTRENVRFVPDRGDGTVPVPAVAAISEETAKQVFGLAADVKMDVYQQDLLSQYNVLAAEISNKSAFYAAIDGEIYRNEAKILPTDQTPVDVIARRVHTLFRRYAYEFAMPPGVTHRPQLQEPLNTYEREIFNHGGLRGLSEKKDPTPEELFAAFVRLCKVRRGLMFRDPLLDFSELLFVKKHRSEFNHICDQYYGRSAVAGGGVFVASDLFRLKYAPRVRDLLENSTVQDGRLTGKKLENGSFVSPDLSFDGKRIAFAFCECTGDASHIDHLDLSHGHTQEGRCYHIFTCNSDGSDLRMITDGTWNDFDPCFLPNGRTAFISERRGGYLRCGRDCPNYTLFDMNADGTQMRCLSYHETNEWNPSVTNDGQIIWTRWDYIDRFGCIVHHPWLTTLEGRDPRSVHGNWSPRHLRADAELDVRAIPDSVKYIATGGPHHGQAYGSLILIDPTAPDDDAMGPTKRLTPDVGFPESQGGAQVWGMPWALSEDLYIAVADYSMQPGISQEGGAVLRGDYGIYLLDSYGNRELLYRDAEIGCASPIPLRARPTPPVVPPRVPDSEIVHQPYVTLPPFEGERPTATMFVQNVYDSLLPWPKDVDKDGGDAKEPEIKSLRIVQVYCMSVPSGYHPHETGYREKSSQDSVNLARSVWGTVPVEKDGSAYFTVPANAEIYFQALDADGLAVQSMRSGTYAQPGDYVSCTGCHEPRKRTPTVSATTPMAMMRAPSEPVRDIEGSRPMSYAQLVQPVLDRHCVECHALPESVEKGAMPLGRDPIERKFYASYNNLVGDRYTPGGYAFYDYGDPLRSVPGHIGARASNLYKILEDDHHDVQLNDEEMHRITLWLDLLSNFYGVYEKEGGEQQLRGKTAYPTLE